MNEHHVRRKSAVHCRDAKRRTAEQSPDVEFRDPIKELGFAKIDHILTLDAGLSDGAYRTYALLCYYWQCKNATWAGVDTLAKVRGVKESTLRKHLKELADVGLITRQRRMGRSSLTYFEDLPEKYTDAAKVILKDRQNKRGKTAKNLAVRPPELSPREEEPLKKNHLNENHLGGSVSKPETPTHQELSEESENIPSSKEGLNLNVEIAPPTALPSAAETFECGWKQAVEGDVVPVSELWDDLPPAPCVEQPSDSHRLDSIPSQPNDLAAPVSFPTRNSYAQDAIPHTAPAPVVVDGIEFPPMQPREQWTRAKVQERVGAAIKTYGAREGVDVEKAVALADPRAEQKAFVKEFAPLIASIFQRDKPIGEDRAVARDIREFRCDPEWLRGRLNAYANGEGTEFRKPEATAYWVRAKIEREKARKQTPCALTSSGRDLGTIVIEE